MSETKPLPKKADHGEERSAWRKAREFLLGAAVSAGITVLALVLWGQAGLLDGLERLTYDSLFDLRHRLHSGTQEAWIEQASKELAIIEYDDASKSLLRIKGMPPRRFFTRVVERTKGLAQVVSFDYYFPRQAYPDSRTAEIDANVRYNAARMLALLGPLRLAEDGTPRGLDRFSDPLFLEDMGLFQPATPEEVETLDAKRWNAFLAEVVRRQQETAPFVQQGEKRFDDVFRELDPALVNLLDEGDGGFSDIARRLSGTVVNTLFLDDIKLGKEFLLAQNVVLARYIDEGGLSIQASDPLFRSAAACEGLINAVKEVDGRLRKVPLTRLAGKKTLQDLEFEFTLSLASVLVAHKIPPAEVVLEGETHAGPFPLPSDMTLWVNYIGGPRSVPYIPLYRFFPEEIDPVARAERELETREPILPPVTDEELQGRILLIGDTTRDGQDYIATPVSLFRDDVIGEVDLEQAGSTLLEMPGVEVHAHAVFNLLHNLWLRKVGGTTATVLCLLLGVASLAFYSHRVGFLFGGLLVVALLAAISVVSYLAFVHGCLVLPLVPAAAVVGLNFVGGVAYQGILQQMKKKAVTSMFGKYVSDNLVQKMVSGDLEVDLEGKEKELTVLFSDIRGFTRISEGLDPGTVSRILRAYFSQMIRTIFENDGTLDKLMGDAIMAFFGDPEDMPHHAVRGAEAALDMLRALEELKQSKEYPAMAGLDIGIGLNTGLMTVGNLGSDEYFDYTVIGDNVNLGSRLEGLNKQYNTRIIVSETTAVLIASEFELRDLGRVTVSGRSRPVRIFELLGRKGDVPRERLEAKTLFETGLRLWEAGDFDTAAERFHEGVEKHGDGPSKVFHRLSREYQEEPPPAPWEGVFIPKGK